MAGHAWSAIVAADEARPTSGSRLRRAEGRRALCGVFFLEHGSAPELVPLRRGAAAVSGVSGAPREVIRACVPKFVDMHPDTIGEKTFCCGGGGGALAMPEFTKRRIAAGKIKADEIRATGATVCLQSCHNCTDQLKEIIDHYKIKAKVINLAELLSPALVL